jgi:hypothetical protein
LSHPRPLCFSAGAGNLILRCWVDDSTAGDLGTEEIITTVVKGLWAIELLAASDRLVVNRTKSAIAAAPGDFRTALAILIQGRTSWDQGGVLVLRQDEVEQDLLNIIAERLGVEGAKVHVGGLDQLHWSKAGKATVLVHLPGAGIPPFTVSAITAGGGVVLRGWPDTWPHEDKKNAAEALREHHSWPRIAMPVVASLKDLGVVIGGGTPGKVQHQQRLLELFKRGKLVGRLGLSWAGASDWSPVPRSRLGYMAARRNHQTPTR